MTVRKHSKRMHWPRFSSYRHPGPWWQVRAMLNQYGEIDNWDDYVTIGASVVIGGRAYCVKWAHAIYTPPSPRSSVDEGNTDGNADA